MFSGSALGTLCLSEDPGEVSVVHLLIPMVEVILGVSHRRSQELPVGVILRVCHCVLAQVCGRQ